MTLRFFDVAAFIFVFCHFANTVEMIKKKMQQIIAENWCCLLHLYLR